MWQPWQLVWSWFAVIQLPCALPPAELRVSAAVAQLGHRALWLIKHAAVHVHKLATREKDPTFSGPPNDSMALLCMVWLEPCAKLMDYSSQPIACLCRAAPCFRMV